MLRSSIVTLALAASRLVLADTLTEVLQANQDTLSTLTDLLGTVPDVVETLSGLNDITVLAPNNDAFSKLVASNPTEGAEEETNPELLTMLLSYHVLNGTFNSSIFSTTPTIATTLLEDPTLTNMSTPQHVELSLSDGEATVFSGLKQPSLVVVADVPFDGGVIHIIDTVLNIPPDVSTAAMTYELTSLAGALTQTNLLERVDTLEDVTVLAPTNEAFAAISSAATSLNDAQLAALLRYHIILGKVAFSPDLLGATELKVMTLAGTEVTIRSSNGAVFINQARVTVTDVLVENGVVHVIDSVLNPDAPDLTPNVESEEAAIGFEGATAGEAPFTENVAAVTENVATGDSVTEAGEAESAASSAGRSWILTAAIGVAVLLVNC